MSAEAIIARLRRFARRSHPVVGLWLEVYTPDDRPALVISAPWVWNDMLTP